jgi:hypothetical protein
MPKRMYRKPTKEEKYAKLTGSMYLPDGRRKYFDLRHICYHCKANVPVRDGRKRPTRYGDKAVYSICDVCI